MALPLLILWTGGGDLLAQAPPGTNDTRRLIEELKALDPELAKELALPKVRAWDAAVTVTTSAGYKDNVLYQSQAPTGSGFARNAAEVTVFRLPVKGWQFHAYTYGEDLRFFFTDQVKKEQTALALAQAKKNWADRWQLTLTAQYLFLDQVMDLDSEFGIHMRVPVLTHAYSPKVALRRDFGRGWWMEGEASLNRQDFLSPLDDYYDAGGRLSLGRQHGHKSDLSLNLEFNHREYETRTVTDANGLPMPGDGLIYARYRLALNWRHYFDARRRWRATTRLALEQNNDNGSGYFDYWKYTISEQVRYQHPNWQISGQVRLVRYDYPVQKASLFTLDLYDRTEVTASVRGEVKLAKGIKWFAEYLFEQNLSNQYFSEYRANTVQTGVNWDF